MAETRLLYHDWGSWLDQRPAVKCTSCGLHRRCWALSPGINLLWRLTYYVNSTANVRFNVELLWVLLASQNVSRKKIAVWKSTFLFSSKSERVFGPFRWFSHRISSSEPALRTTILESGHKKKQVSRLNSNLLCWIFFFPPPKAALKPARSTQ